MAARLGLNTTTQSIQITDGAVTTGTVICWGGATIPSGWLELDGSSLSRTDYARLFSILGTIYGSADSSHFNLPNLAGRVPIGSGTYTDPVSGSVIRFLGTSNGAEKHKVLNAESGEVAHSHARGSVLSVSAGNHTHYTMSKYFGTGIIEFHTVPNYGNVAYSLMGGMVFGGAASKVSFSSVLGIYTGLEPSRIQTSYAVGSGYNSSGQHTHTGPNTDLSFTSISELATAHNNMQPYIVQKWIIKV
jgi:microcystin-dependent protein